MSRAVPQRLIRPFFQRETSGLRGHAVDQRVVEESGRQFSTRKPPYRILTGNRIELHPDWHSYLRTNAVILRGWALWHWARHMQSRNPSVPAIITKLSRVERKALPSRAKRFWEQVVEREPAITCLYSDAPLADVDVALDHFLPWAYVGHDELWNLSPVLARANGLKADSLPHASYLVPFVVRQAKALIAARPHYRDRAWVELTEPYVLDVKVPADVLWARRLDPAALRHALDRNLLPHLRALHALARRRGFRPWHWMTEGPPFAHAGGPGPS